VYAGSINKTGEEIKAVCGNDFCHDEKKKSHGNPKHSPSKV